MFVSSTSFMGGIPSNVASNRRRWSTTPAQAKTAFSLSSAQKKIGKVSKVGGSSSKTGTGTGIGLGMGMGMGTSTDRSRSNWETVTAGLMPHFASFSPPSPPLPPPPLQDWERHDDDGFIVKHHPYASAGGEESFLSVNDEKTDKDKDTASGSMELPTFVSCVPPPFFFKQNKNLTLPRKTPN